LQGRDPVSPDRGPILYGRCAAKAARPGVVLRAFEA